MTTRASAWAQCLDSQILTAVSHLSTTIRIRFLSAAQQTALLTGSIKLELSAMQTCISLDFQVPPVCIRLHKRRSVTSMMEAFRLARRAYSLYLAILLIRLNRVSSAAVHPTR